MVSLNVSPGDRVTKVARALVERAKEIGDLVNAVCGDVEVVMIATPDSTPIELVLGHREQCRTFYRNAPDPRYICRPRRRPLRPAQRVTTP